MGCWRLDLRDLFGLIFKFIFLFYLLSKMCLLGLFFTHSESGAFGAHAGWFWPTWHLSRHACVWQEEPHWRKGLHQIVCRLDCGRSVIGGRACTTEWCRPWADGPGLYKKQAEQVMEKQGRKQHPPWFLFLPLPALGSCSGIPWEWAASCKPNTPFSPQVAFSQNVLAEQQKAN